MTNSANIMPILDFKEIRNRSEMVRPLLDGPTQFSLDWLRRNKWIAVPVADSINDMDAEWLAYAAQSMGCTQAFAISTELSIGEKLSAYRVELNQKSLLALDMEVSLQHFIIVPDSLGFSLLLEGDYYFIVAGPESFVGRAIGCSYPTARAMFLDRYAEDDEWPVETRELLVRTWLRYERLRDEVLKR